MAERRLPPAEEARVRMAALVAGQRMTWDVPRAVLDYIVATSDARQNPAALEARAAGIVEYVRNHPDKPDFANATDRHVQSFFQTIHGQAVHLFGGLPYVLASREEDASAGETGARFDAMYTGTDWGSEAGQRYMRNYARQCGVGWAADHADLMRLGPAAIHALRDANFRRESFQRLRDAGFDRREAATVAVGIARYANRHGLDANRIAEETAGAVNSFGADRPEERRRWIERFERFYQNPDDEAARADMSRALTEMETRGTAEQRDHVRRLRPLLRLDQEARAELGAATLTANRAEATASTATASHRAAVAGNDDLMADLNAGPVAPAGRRTAEAPHAPGPQRTIVAENTVQPAGPRLG